MIALDTAVNFKIRKHSIHIKVNLYPSTLLSLGPQTLKTTKFSSLFLGNRGLYYDSLVRGRDINCCCLSAVRNISQTFFFVMILFRRHRRDI